MKRGNKKCGNDEVFQLVSESLENEINREFFEEILKTLIQKQQMKANFYGNRTCLSIPKEDQANKTKANDADNLIKYFINFKTHLIEQFKTMNLKVKNQLLNQTDSASASSILERLIVKQQEQISILREQLDQKGIVIDKLLEKLEKRDKESFSQCCPSKVLPYIQTTTPEKSQEKQNSSKQQQLNPTQHNAAPSNHNKKSATKYIISSANINNTSSDSENGTTHTSENAGDEQSNISDNPLILENVQK